MSNEMAKIDPAVRERFGELVVRARSLEAREVDELQRLFARYPDLWRAVDMARTAASTMIQKEGDGMAVSASLDANYEGKRRDLSRPQDGPLEAMLVEHVALCWLRLQMMEQKYTGATSQSLSLAQGDYWERKLSSAQRRYLRAAETLARVRRLALPVMQVNIADKQVNLAGR